MSKKLLNTAALAKIITENPGCVLHVDNDNWELTKQSPPDDEPDDFDYDAWLAENYLASDRDMIECNNVYAGDVLEALALLAKVTVEYA